MLKAGNLNRVIIIESASQAQDNMGTPVKTWSTYATLWAEFLPRHGQEQDKSGKLIASQLADFKVRKDTSLPITEKMRINYDGYYWDILSTVEIGFNEGVSLLCRRTDNMTV